MPLLWQRQIAFPTPPLLPCGVSVVKVHLLNVKACVLYVLFGKRLFSNRQLCRKAIQILRGFALLQEFELDVNINTDVLLNKITEKYVAFITVCE